MATIKSVGTTGFAPYSPAIKVNGFIYCSGQIGMDNEGNLVSGLTEQTEKAFERAIALLTEAGSDLSHVVKTTVFLSGSMAGFDEVNTTYRKYFKEPYPARSCVAVAALPKGALVEIELIAIEK